MAWLSVKKRTSPMKELTIPKKLKPIVQAFYAESEEIARELIIQAAKAIYNEKEEDCFSFEKRTITNVEIEVVCEYMHSLKPKDTIEAILAAQIVVSQMLGMRKLAKNGVEEQRMGLKLLRFNNEVMRHFQKKRSGCSQNITVNYNYIKTETSQLGTVIPIQEE